MEKRKNLTACEALDLSTSSHFLENDIYKAIRDAATHCRVEIRYSINNSMKSTVEQMVATLRADGYTVTYLYYDYRDNLTSVNAYTYISKVNKEIMLSINWGEIDVY